MQRIVVVGASLAGLRTAEALRREGFSGELVVIGDEPHPPYDRPPLSKQYLAGEWDDDRVRLPPAPDLGVRWRLGERATGLDLDGRAVVVDGGGHVPFDGLVIATGARPRTIPGTVALRTLDDARALRQALRDRPRLAVIGAGFIGSEVASTAHSLGCDVTVVEALPAPLVRALGEEMGRALGALHTAHGVDLQVGRAVTDVAELGAEVVVAGIGVVPNTEWLEGSGLTLDNGVVCDSACAAVGADGVVAVGDVARWPNPRFGEAMRVEHWTNAVEQAEAAARTLLGRPQPFAPVPYFWSDQYGSKIQFVGVAGPSDSVEVVEGEPGEGRFVAVYRRDGRVVGALGLDRPARIMAWRRRIEEEPAGDRS